MGSAFADRRARLMQAKQADALKARLICFDVADFVAWSDLPGSVAGELAATRRTDARPDDTLPATADESALREWIRAVLVASGVVGRFLLLTGIEHFPWLEVAPREDTWLGNLIAVKGPAPAILSADRATLVVFYDEEHEYQAFRRRL